MQPLQVYGPRGLKDMTEHVLAAYRVDLDNRMEERGQKYRMAEAHEISPGVVYRDAKVTVTGFRGPARQSGGLRLSLPDSGSSDRDFRRHELRQMTVV